MDIEQAIAEHLASPPVRRGDGTRFWEVPTAAVVIQRCAGDARRLAVWIVVAAAERQDRALGLPGRSLDLIAAHAGVDISDCEEIIAWLVDQGLLTRTPGGGVRVPWSALYLASLEAAQVLAERANQYWRNRRVSPSLHQEPLL